MLIFAAGTVVLIISELTPKGTELWTVSPHIVYGVAAALFVVLSVAPRHTFLPAGVFTVLAPVVLLTGWLMIPEQVDLDGEAGPARALTVRSLLVWSIPLAMLLGFEYVAILASNVTRDGVSWPTISSMLDPLFNAQPGQTLCVLIWVFSGILLFAPRSPSRGTSQGIHR